MRIPKEPQYQLKTLSESKPSQVTSHKKFSRIFKIWSLLDGRIFLNFWSVYICLAAGLEIDLCSIDMIDFSFSSFDWAKVDIWHILQVFQAKFSVQYWLIPRLIFEDLERTFLSIIEYA